MALKVSQHHDALDPVRIVFALRRDPSHAERIQRKVPFEPEESISPARHVSFLKSVHGAASKPAEPLAQVHRLTDVENAVFVATNCAIQRPIRRDHVCSGTGRDPLEVKAD